MKTRNANQTMTPEALLRQAGLRPTRQRLVLARLLFDGCHKHVTAEELHRRAARKAPLSLATVYNALHQLTAAGLLRQVTVDHSSIYFDTNTGDHHHFYDVRSGRLADVDADSVRLSAIPEAPAGRTVERVDVIIRVK